MCKTRNQFSDINTEVLEQVLSALVDQLIPQQRPRATMAVDATGLTPGVVSTFFVKRAKDQEPGFTWRYWLKRIMAVDVDRRVILAQTARRGPMNDCATLRPLVSAAHERVPIALVLADAEFDSERNHQYVRQTLQAQSIIPAKRGGVADSRRAGLHASGFSRAPIFPARADRKRHLRRQTQALGTRTGSLALYAMPAGAAVGRRVQHLSPVI
jgi:hypothetical protein